MKKLLVFSIAALVAVGSTGLFASHKQVAQIVGPDALKPAQLAQIVGPDVVTPVQLAQIVGPDATKKILA